MHPAGRSGDRADDCRYGEDRGRGELDPGSRYDLGKIERAEPGAAGGQEHRDIAQNADPAGLGTPGIPTRPATGAVGIGYHDPIPSRIDSGKTTTCDTAGCKRSRPAGSRPDFGAVARAPILQPSSLRAA